MKVGLLRRGWLLAAACASAVPLAAQGEIGLEGVRAALAAGSDELAAGERAWRASLAPAGGADAAWAELFGYAPPGGALSLASLAAFLYVRDGARPADARLAAEYLLRMARYRDDVPPELVAARVEYAAGLPAVPSFFHLADYAEAWARVRGEPSLDPSVVRELDEAVAGSADFVFTFPEWGAHNRALLRAECLAWCARALPDHPRAGEWRRMAEILFDDSRAQWEIEDAAHYQPIWLLAWLRAAEALDVDARASLRLHLALRRLVQLLTPTGDLPAYGDAWWGSSRWRLSAALAWGAALFQDPELAWGAQRVWAALGPYDPTAPGVARARQRALYDAWLDRVPAPRAPDPRRLDAVDEALAKKVVWRSGWGREDAYLCLNYRDQGDWGARQRDVLRETLAVVEEKAHHGHADEGAVVLWMDGGSVLLHDAGYRETAPSGPHGAWRADVFHDKLVGRPVAWRPGQPLGEALLDDGAYRATRTREVDALDLSEVGVRYARVRVDEVERGFTTERTLLYLEEERVLVVVDDVRVERAGEWLFAPLWAAQEVLEVTERGARTAYRSIEGHALPDARELVLDLGRAPERFPLRRHRQDEWVLATPVSRSFEVGERCTFVSVLGSVERGRPAPWRVERDPGEPTAGGVALRIVSPGATCALLVATDLSRGWLDADVRPRVDPEGARLAAFGLATDGDLLIARERGGAVDWSVVSATFAEVAGREVFRARPMQVFQTSARSDVVGRARWRRWSGHLPATSR